MSEPALSTALSRRMSRVLWRTLAAYAALVTVGFAAFGELALRRSIEGTAAAVESLLGLYADPGGARTTVAPAMLADQLLGMGARFLITRTVSSGEEASVYFLSPDMPAKEIEAGAPPDEVQRQLRAAIAERGRWRYWVLHRRAGEFDVYVAGSRGPMLTALLGVGAAALVLLPFAAVLARRAADRSVGEALAPVRRVREETLAINPDDLSARVSAPTGVAEISEIAQAINRLVERVERSHDALEAFTADASHELRTPLTRLRAQSHWALDERRTPEDLREALAAVGREVDDTVKMVEDLLLIARGQNRQLQITRETFELAPVVQEVGEITAAMVEDRDIAVRVDVGGPVRAQGDPNRTRRVLLNLASNAVRYTERGSISFRCGREGAGVFVEVTDTGCGIPAPHRERIFDRFYRVEASRSRAYGGAGLGLTIARLLAELQGGGITLQSAEGEGSRFMLTLPAAD